jgi:hypothetical protein
METRWGGYAAVPFSWYRFKYDVFVGKIHKIGRTFKPLPAFRLIYRWEKGREIRRPKAAG